MSHITQVSVQLRLWAAEDLPLLHQLLGDPSMTEHLGGPESAEQIARRHERYLHLVDLSDDRMYAILVGPELEPAGSVGYWEKEWQDKTVYETGWSVLPAFQGKGIATKATEAVLAILRVAPKHHYVHAFPSVANAASNAICRKTGFTLMGEHAFEYPKGHWMHCNDWRFDLTDDHTSNQRPASSPLL